MTVAGVAQGQGEKKMRFRDLRLAVNDARQGCAGLRQLDERVAESALRNDLSDMRVEITVGTARKTKRPVNVKRQCFRRIGAHVRFG